MNIRVLCSAVACAVLAPAAWAQGVAALPTGGQVVAGQGSVQTQGSVMTVNQTSQRLAIDWQSFNIGAGGAVNFVQPNAQATALNRVLGSDVSTIQGQITANGRVYLLNPNGILFTPSAQVNVGGLVASTLGMSTTDFMAGNDRLAGSSAGAVINQGQIRTAQGGTVALVAARVTNLGEISTPSGAALLAAGRKVRLHLGGPAQIEVEEGALNALIEQSGSIRAADGMVFLTAKAASQLSGSAINQNGLIEAGSIDATGGLVVLEADHIRLGSGSRMDATGATGGGTVLVGGDWQGSGNLRQAITVTMASGSVIDASATEHGDGGKVVLWSDVHNAQSVSNVNGAVYAKGGALGGDGGQIETSGANLETSSIRIDASAQVASAKAGLWLIDPFDYLIDSTAAANIVNALNTGASGTSVTVSTQTNTASQGSTGPGTGNITVDSAINADTSKAANFSLMADGTVTLNASLAVGGHVSITTSGLSGTGGIALVSGKSLTVNQSGDSAYGGVVSGAGATLVKQGTGALTLSADHTYTGSTTISGGTLQVGNGGATGSLATSAVTNNGILRYYSGTDKTVPYVISGTGQVEIKGGESELFSNFLTTTPQTVATNTTVLDVLERMAGGTQNGAYINCSAGGCIAIPAGAYNKKYDAAGNYGTFQIQSYFDGRTTSPNNANQFTKVVFVKLTQSGNDVLVSAYQGRGSNYAVYVAGNKLGDDFATAAITGGYQSVATTSTAAGYGVDKLYSSSKITFTANNTYTGTTRILNTLNGATVTLQDGNFSTYERKTLGILSLGAGGTAGNIAATQSVINQGLLIFNRSDDLEFDRDISGAGNLIKDNTNTVSYLGSGTYTGVTYVNAGTLSVGDGNTSGSLTGNINNKGDVTFNRSDDSTYGGIISGTGTLTKSGDAALTLTANHTYTGASSITGGELILANNAPTTATSGFSGSGRLVIQPAGNDFSSAFTTSGWNFASNLGGLTIGKSTSSADGTSDVNVTLNSAVNIAGPVSLYGGNVAVNAALTASRVTLKGSGTVSQTGAITANDLLLLGGNVTLDHDNNNITTVAASQVGSLKYWDSNALTIGTVGGTDGISATGAVDVQTLSGHLTVAKNVATTNGSSSAVILNASRATDIASAAPAVGADTAGDIRIGDGVTISTGANGRVVLYTGSIDNSQGVAAAAGCTTAPRESCLNLRYGSDEATTRFSTALGSGTFAIYREKPSIGGTYVYGDSLPQGIQVNNSIMTGNYLDVGSYTIASGGNANLADLGYTAGVTVTARPINITANSGQSKVYGDGNPVLAYTPEVNGAGRGLMAGDVFTGALSRAAGENVGNSYAIAQGTLANSNYSINFTGGSFAVTPRPITVTLDAKSKTYGDSDPKLSYRISSGNLIGSDALTLARRAGEAPGRYLISASNPNYQVSGANAYLTIAKRIETATVVNGLLTVAPVQPAAQATSSPAPFAPAAIVNPAGPLASANAAAQVSSGLMMIPIGADQVRALEAAAPPSAQGSDSGARPAAAGWLQSAQSLGYTGVLVVEGGVRLPDGVR